jgi:phenylalanyl-tRNA synthetase beta chain
MFISINWIKDYVDLSGIETDELVKRFNLSTAEIEGVEVKGKNIQNVVFGKVLSVEKHPESTHLHVLKVDVGDEVLQIVCGAPNVHEGMVTAVCKVGGSVCAGKIKQTKLVGVESNGMCCAEAELGIGSDDDGIMDIDEPVEIGADIKSVWPVDDIVLEIDNKSLTNRPDLWGHYGMAREFAAIFDRPLNKMPVDDLSKYDSLQEIPVSIETENCYRYSAISVQNVNVHKSPRTMAIRLNYAGMRDINLLADLTNYVMLDTGLPMHAFDNKIVDAINVIESDGEVVMTTLEGEEHKPPKNAILISDKDKVPVAIAGIKGGLKSGISDATNSVVFEAAVFNCENIRKTSRAIGLITDASQRYEKSLDPEITPVALSRILYLLKTIDGGVKVSSRFSDCYKKKYDKIKIELDPKFIGKIVGTEISKEFVVKTLKALEFGVKDEGGKLVVDVPSFRATKDVSIKEDLVEEVARLYGYDNIEPKPLAFDAEPQKLIASIEYEYDAKLLLAEKYNANEIHSYLWNYEDFNKAHKIDMKSYVSLMDSSNAGQSGIRSELVPTLLRCLDENKNNYQDVRVFEIGRVVSGLDEENLCIENKKIAIVFASQTKSEFELFTEMKTAIVDIAKNIIGIDVMLAKGDTVSYLHPVNSFRVVSRTDDFGVIGVIHPEVKRAIDKRFNVVALEIDFEKLANSRGYAKKIKNVSKYQAVDVDYNIVCSQDMIYDELSKILNKFKSKILSGYSLVDIYENNVTLAGKKSVTIRFNLSSLDHTLSGEEIEKFRTDFVEFIGRNGLEIRG